MASSMIPRGKAAIGHTGSRPAGPWVPVNCDRCGLPSRFKSPHRPCIVRECDPIVFSAHDQRAAGGEGRATATETAIMKIFIADKFETWGIEQLRGLGAELYAEPGLKP